MILSRAGPGPSPPIVFVYASFVIRAIAVELCRKSGVIFCRLMSQATNSARLPTCYSYQLILQRLQHSTLNTVTLFLHINMKLSLFLFGLVALAGTNVESHKKVHKHSASKHKHLAVSKQPTTAQYFISKRLPKNNFAHPAKNGVHCHRWAGTEVDCPWPDDMSWDYIQEDWAHCHHSESKTHWHEMIKAL